MTIKPVFTRSREVARFPRELPKDWKDGEKIKDLPPSGNGGSRRFINLGLLPLDDPIYSTGPIVAGRPILKSPKKKSTEND